MYCYFLHKIKILLIDDDVDITLTFRTALEEEGHDVVHIMIRFWFYQTFGRINMILY